MYITVRIIETGLFSVRLLFKVLIKRKCKGVKIISNGDGWTEQAFRFVFHKDGKTSHFENSEMLLKWKTFSVTVDCTL